MYALLILLYCGILAYHTYKVMVEQCFPAGIWVVTLAMNVLEDMNILEADVYRSHVVLQNHRFYWILLYFLLEDGLLSFV